MVAFDVAIVAVAMPVSSSRGSNSSRNRDRRRCRRQKFERCIALGTYVHGGPGARRSPETPKPKTPSTLKL